MRCSSDFVREVNAAKGYTALSFHDVNRAANEGRGFIFSDYAKWGIHFSNPKEGRGGMIRLRSVGKTSFIAPLGAVQRIWCASRTFVLISRRCKYTGKINAAGKIRNALRFLRANRQWPTRRPTKALLYLFACDNFKKKFACNVKSKKRCVWRSNACTAGLLLKLAIRAKVTCRASYSLMNSAICSKNKGYCAWKNKVLKSFNVKCAFINILISLKIYFYFFIL